MQKFVLDAQVPLPLASIVLVFGVMIALVAQELAVVSLVPAQTSRVEAAGLLYVLIFGTENSVLCFQYSANTGEMPRKGLIG